MCDVSDVGLKQMTQQIPPFSIFSHPYPTISPSQTSNSPLTTSITTTTTTTTTNLPLIITLLPPYMGLFSLPMPPKPKASTTITNATTTTNAATTTDNMGLLVVFFPQHNNNDDNDGSPNTQKTTTNLNFSDLPPSKKPPSFKRTNSNNLIISKTQSTISICALLLFLTLLLFTLSTFEPNTANPRHKPPQITAKYQPKTPNRSNNWFLQRKIWPNNPLNFMHFPSKALQGMGTLYRRGTRAMTDLVVCHVADETSVHDFRLFLRLIHRSGLTARSDVVFLFASSTLSSSFAKVIREENDAFSSLVELHSELNSTRWRQLPESSFDLTRFFVKVGKKGEANAEPLWGRRMRNNSSQNESSHGGELVLSYGSVLSFDAAELDPENSLAGFLDRVPLSLRRWACYPMLLGRVRRNFKHVMLIDVKSVLVTGDPLGRVRNRSSESVFLFARYGKRNSELTRSNQRLTNSAVVIGGARGVRRLANAVLVEIVRAAMQQRKRKNSVSESSILSQLASSELMLKEKGIELADSDELIPEASQLDWRKYSIIQRGISNHDFISSVFKKQICSSVVDSSVYRDC